MNICKTISEDLHDVHTLLSAAEVNALKLRAVAVAHFLRAKDKPAAVAELRRTFGRECRALSLKTLYRLAKRFDGTLASLMDGRLVRKLTKGGLAANAEFVAFWQQLVLENKRATAPAYRELFRRLASGAAIPGFGTWREIYAAEHGGLYPAPERVCVYEPSRRTPKGWTLRNLARLAPDRWAVTAARKGTMAAALETLPDIRRTRAGLKSCRVVQIDDMWYEHKVAFAGNRMAQRVVEFAMIDVATGYFVSYLPKPVRERADGTRETLENKWVKYLFAYLLGTVGIPDEGVIIMGEHGTASADEKYQALLAEVTGGRVTFTAGGLLSTPLAKGLYEGTPKGNPRFKGLLEGQHSLIKNELAAVKGHMGGGREGKSEWVYGMEKEDRRLRALARALAETRPGIERRLDFPFMEFADFAAIIAAMYEGVNTRRTHALEGWDEQGFTGREYFDATAGAWVPLERVREQPAGVREALLAAVASGAVRTRQYRMSPAEAWAAREGDRAWRLKPASVALEVMGPELARPCRCTDRLTLRYKDPETGAEAWVSGVLEGGGTLRRGEVYQVWINPLDAFKAFVADEHGRFIGCARVIQKARYDDREAIERAMGLRQKALAEELGRVRPALGRMQREAAARLAANAEAVLGYDPAQRAAVADAARGEIARADAADVLEEAAPDAETPGIAADDLDVEGHAPACPPEIDADEINSL